MTGRSAGRLVPLQGDIVDRALDRATGGRSIPGNAVQLLTDGPTIFEATERLIRDAERWIHLDNYIIRDDATGRRFAALLMARGREGLQVRVLTDWLGSAGTHRVFWSDLRAAGVELRFFNPPRWLDLAGNFTRDHRKLLVTDAGRSVIGGYCFGDEWAGDPARGRRPWRETALLIDGPASVSLDHAFHHAWATTGFPLPAEESTPDVNERGAASVRVLAGEPGRLRAYRATEFLVAAAGHRIWITDAYFVAPRRFRDSLLDAARDGVDVRILVPGSSDLPFVRNLTRFGYRDLLREGIRIFEWGGPMLHAKTAVIDGRWVRVGSSNVNVQSLLGNWELDVLVDDPRLADQCEGQYRRDVERSAEVTRRMVRAPRPVERVLPSVLDIAEPEASEGAHLPGMRERGQRTVRALRAVVAGARLSIFVPAGLAALGFAALFYFLPRATAAVFVILSLWVAIASGVEATRRIPHV